MASPTEILATLQVIEKQSYVALIDVATEQYPSKKIQYGILSSFMENRINRLTAIQTLIGDKAVTNDITGNYTQFQAALGKISGKNNDLDFQNGLLGQNINGDVRNRKFLKREILELTKKNVLITTEILDRYDTFKTDMDAIKAILT